MTFALTSMSNVHPLALNHRPLAHTILGDMKRDLRMDQQRILSAL